MNSRICGEVHRLQRSQAAVQRLVVVEGGAGAEVALVDERHRQAAQRRVPRREGAVDAGADDEQIEAWCPPGGGGRAPSVGHCTIAELHDRPSTIAQLLERAHPRSRDDRRTRSARASSSTISTTIASTSCTTCPSWSTSTAMRPATARGRLRHRHRSGALRQRRRLVTGVDLSQTADRSGAAELRAARPARGESARRQRRGAAVRRRVVRRRLRPRRAAVHRRSRGGSSPRPPGAAAGRPGHLHGLQPHLVAERRCRR